MKKYIILVLILCLFPIVNVLASFLDITGENVILYNMKDDSVIFEQNSDEKTSIASLTKIMTSLVALENISNLNAKVLISDSDFLETNGYSKAGFHIGDEVTYLDLLYGVLLPSGAEAVNALVNNTFKSSKDFISAMNDKAIEIGLNDTSFSNPIGKDDSNNYSTAKDIAKLLKYALKNTTFKKIFTTKKYTTSNGLLLESTINNYTSFLDTDLIIGSKSGFTKNAGRCLASITTINGVDYLLVIINSSIDKPYNAVKDTITIYNYYSGNYSYQQIFNNEEVLATIPVKWSKQKNYNIVVHDKTSMYLENSIGSNLTYDYVGEEEIAFNTKKGAKLGDVNVYNDGILLYTTPVYLEEEIVFYPFELLFIFSGFVLIIILIFIKKIRRKK